MADNFVQSAVANAAAQTAQANAATQAADTEQPADVQPADETSSIPSISARIPRKNSKATTLESSIRNSLFGGGSLSSPTMHIGAIRSDVRRALKFDPTNTNLQAAQQILSGDSVDVNGAQGFLEIAYASIGGKTPKSMSRMIVSQTTAPPVPPTSADNSAVPPMTTPSNAVLTRKTATVQGLMGQKSSSSGVLSSNKRIII